MTIRELLAFQQHLFRRNLRFDSDRIALDRETKTDETVGPILPLRNELLEECDFFRKGSRMTRVSRQPTLNLFPNDLPDTEFNGGTRKLLERRFR